MNKGFNGMPGNIQALMKEAQKMQEKLKKSQEDAESFIYEAQTGGGAVRVKLNGKYKVLEIYISPDVIANNDPEMLQDLLFTAFNEAVDKITEYKKEEMSKATGGMPIPGLF